jgi:basic amino acid/polyamine antiporter, APA family
MSAPALDRRIGPLDATLLGVGSMLGAGVFAAFAPAAAAAGPALLVGLAIAGVVAFCNATASAQLAAQYPLSGGTYLYGRERLGAWPGFLAGWGFVVGKTASAAAMAATVAAYAVPGPAARPVGAAVVLALAAVNVLGITRTAAATRVIVVVVLAVLTTVVVAGLAAPSAAATAAGPAATPYGVLQSAGLLFFAFAGYARIATLGEEVRDPARTIPRAVVAALTIVLVVYALVGVTALRSLGPAALAAAPAPLVAVVDAAAAPGLAPVVRLGGSLAALGALLALLAGVGRTALAMARERDLPAPLAAVHPRFRTPYRAEAAAGIAAAVLVLSVDLRSSIGFSSFGVLLYYAVANAAAFTQRPPHRRYPRVLQVVGLAGCLTLVVTLPPVAVGAGVAVFVAGALYRILARRARTRV